MTQYEVSGALQIDNSSTSVTEKHLRLSRGITMSTYTFRDRVQFIYLSEDSICDICGDKMFNVDICGKCVHYVVDVVNVSTMW